MKHLSSYRTILVVLASLLLVLSITSCSGLSFQGVPILGIIILGVAWGFVILVLLVSLWRFVSFLYRKYVPYRCLVGRTLYMLREDDDNETWNFIDANHVLVTNKDGFTKEYSCRLYRNGRLRVNHYRNDDVVIIDVQNTWEKIIEEDFCKEVIISNAHTIVSGKMGKYHKISIHDYVKGVHAEHEVRNFAFAMKQKQEWSIRYLFFALIDVKYILFFIYIDEIKKFLHQLGLNEFFVFIGLTVVLILFYGYFFEIRPYVQKEKIEECAKEEYYGKLMHEGELTSNDLEEYLKFDKAKRKANYVKKVKSRKVLYKCRWWLGILLVILDLWILGWWIDFCLKRDYGGLIFMGGFLLIMLGGYLVWVPYVNWEDKVEERAKKQFERIGKK